MFVNGYNITGNHATTGREYHVCDAAGVVLAAIKGPVAAAMAFAAAQVPGDVTEPVAAPEPPILSPLEQQEIDDQSPKPAVKKAAKKAGRKQP